MMDRCVPFLPSSPKGLCKGAIGLRKQNGPDPGASLYALLTSGARGQAAYRYRYDDIGNRIEAAVDGFDEAAQRTSYEANALNQYTAIHHPDPAKRRVQGSAHAQAAIEAKASAPGAAPGDAVALPVARGGPQGSGFSATAEAAVGDGAAWRRIEVTATRPAVGVGGGAMRTAREGWQYFPPKEETPLHDHDGNLTSDARWLYWWDAENRLTAMEEKAGAAGPGGAGSPKRQRLEFAYDGESRRVRKRVLEWSTEMNSWVLRRDVRFLYDGWSMIAEFEAKGGASGPLALSATYAWGLDLSGTETGAGGVGGLLFVSLYSTTTTQTTVNNSQPPPTCILAPCYDGNGNVLAYADTVSGTVVARYEYDPFGQVIIREEAASVVGRLHHQFSTKYTDSETGLVYYGSRYYSPEFGRWPNRDPIGEGGGLSLYGMVGNDAVNRGDYLGKWGASGGGSNDPPVFSDNPKNFSLTTKVTWTRLRCHRGSVTRFIQVVFNPPLAVLFGVFPIGRIEDFVDDGTHGTSASFAAENWPYYGDNVADFEDGPSIMPKPSLKFAGPANARKEMGYFPSVHVSVMCPTGRGTISIWKPLICARAKEEMAGGKKLGP